MVVSDLEEVDLVIRNDAGENSFDNIEISVIRMQICISIISKTVLLILKKADNLATLLIHEDGLEIYQRARCRKRKSMLFLL